MSGRNKVTVTLSMLLAASLCATALAQERSKIDDGQRRETVSPVVQAKPAPASGEQSQQDLRIAKERHKKLESAVATFDELIRRKRPMDLTGEQVTEWNQQTAWLKSIRNRYKRMAQYYSAAERGEHKADMGRMNTQFMDLQNSIQQESRKYQTLSNASKARHDIAMNAIRNTRA